MSTLGRSEVGIEPAKPGSPGIPGKAPVLDSAADFPDSAQEPLDAEYVPAGKMLGHLQDKSAFSKTEVDLDRGLGLIRKNLLRRETAKPVIRPQLMREGALIFESAGHVKGKK